MPLLTLIRGTRDKCLLFTDSKIQTSDFENLADYYMNSKYSLILNTKRFCLRHSYVFWLNFTTVNFLCSKICK